MTQQDPTLNVTPGISSSIPLAPSSSGVTPLISATSVKQMLIEPLNVADNGECIAQAIRSAQQSVWLEVYLLTHSNVINALLQAATPDPVSGQKKDVRVILEPRAYTAGAAVSYQQVVQELTAGGVQVQKNATHLGYGGETHAKLMLIDGQVAYIMTANLTSYSLGSMLRQTPQKAANREYMLIDTDPQRIAVLTAIFAADWDANMPRFDHMLLQSSALVISPSFGGSKKNVVGNALSVLQQLIQSAQATIQIEMEEIHENPSYLIIEQALIQAATPSTQNPSAQPVGVQLILPEPPFQGKATTQQDVDTLTGGGVQIRFLANPIMHAKLILVDVNVVNGQVVGGIAFVGSQNLSTNGMQNNREIGILISDPVVLYQLWQTFQQDWGNAQQQP